jgi:hypothetical protein
MGIEVVKGIDVIAEITNVYARSTQTAGNARAVVVDVDYEVHMMFAKLPQIEVLPPTAVSYLFRREGGNIASIRLKDPES